MKKSLQELYGESLPHQQGLAKELNASLPQNRGRIVIKHIRFQIFDLMIRRLGFDSDLTCFLLKHHHFGDECSRRDMTEELRALSLVLSKEDKSEIITQAISNIEIFLSQVRLVNTRTDVVANTREKAQIILSAITTAANQADNDVTRYFIERIASFDVKMIEAYIKSFELPMRDYSQRHSSKGYHDKQSPIVSARNTDHWSKPENKKTMSAAMKQSWRNRRNGNGSMK